MQKIFQILPAVVLLVTGCATTPPKELKDSKDLNEVYPAEQAQIQKRLLEIFDAATKKDLVQLDSYHLYGTKFTKFATESPDRQDSTTARQAEHSGLEAVSGMKVHLENLKIDVFQDVSVATFILHYSFTVGTETVEREAKATLVLADDHGSWKIVHEHFSARK